METLWRPPGPATGLVDSPRLEKRLGREVALVLKYEQETDGTDILVSLVFDGTEAFRCTYYNAIGQSASSAYNRLSDVGASPWLSEVKSNLAFHQADLEGLTHMMIMFDDGPCYEFICRTFRVEE
jgi:hypothetical protein